MKEIDWKEFIETNPEILFGKPVIKGSRIPVDLILEKLAFGETFEQLLSAYPKLTMKSIYACLFFAAERVKNEIVISIAA